MVNLRVNGKIHSLDVDENTPLLWVLRDIIELTGTKFGCGMAMCGACTVHADGVAIRSCTTSLAKIRDKEITTIEGLGVGGLHPVQKAWIEHNVPQCGYCQPGQIMSASALLAINPSPSDDEIDVAMSGNLCRCGTYPRIRDAIKTAAQFATQSGGCIDKQNS